MDELKRYIAALAGAVLLFAAASALGSTASDCGNYVPTSPGHGYWTYRTVYGYTPVFGLNARRVRCSWSRTFSLQETSKMLHHFQGYACKIRWFNGEDWDIRCTQGARVIHWTGGA